MLVLSYRIFVRARVPVKVLGEAFVNGARNIIGVACACAVAGIIVGIVTLTGLGLKLGGGLLTAAGGNMYLTLFFTMITSLVLGMVCLLRQTI